VTITDSPKDANAFGCRDFVAGLAKAGVTVAFISPGSRNTPLTLALSASPAIRDVSVRDERSAAFAALGHAKATGVPAVVVCTSGSAGTHYFPAVVEANQAAVPLVVLTADRPVRLRGTFSPQTMDQTDLYGRHVKAFIDVDIAHDGIKETAHALVRTARGGIPGPIHANFPFEEPLTPSFIPDPDRSFFAPQAPTLGSRLQFDALPDFTGRRVLIVAGGGHGPGFADALGSYAREIGAPLLADAQCRPESDVTVTYAHLLASADALNANPPDVVLRVGGLPTSKAVSTWLATSGSEQILVHRSRLTDPLGAPLIDISPGEFVARAPRQHTDKDYLAQWQHLDEVARSAIAAGLNSSELSEPGIARTALAAAPADSVLFAGSSMPIRDVDTFAEPRSNVTVIANRGVNGIDGSISTALGIADAGIHTTVLIGDVSALHDVSALAEVASAGVPMTIVVINNDGGGIFSFLPQKQDASVSVEVYERHWGTPHGLSLATIADGFGLRARPVDTLDELAEAVSEGERPLLVEARTERGTNVDVHRHLATIVAEAIAGDAT